MSDRTRSTIFISHANPSDNDFVVWLGSRLSSLGYKTWVDLDDLKGGNKLWPEIERVIRTEAIKVLVITSKNSRASDGVEKEIIIAQGVEKEFELENFVLQLKIDDLPFSQLPPQINNQFVYNFENNWGAQLGKLCSDLRDYDVPTDYKNRESKTFTNFLSQKNNSQIDKTGEEHSYLSWLSVTLPTRLFLYPANKEAKTQSTYLEESDIPAKEFKGGVYSFAMPETVEHILGFPPKKPIEVTTTAFLASAFNSLTRTEKVRILNSLVNQAWQIELRSAGMKQLDLSNEKAFYVGADPEFKVPYLDPLGRKTRPVKLVGKTKKGIYNIAISATSAMTPFPHLETRLHVAFTSDGHKLIADGDKAFRLRNSFCKSFWNDRWRRLYFALYQKLSNSSQGVLLRVGGEEAIVVSEPISVSTKYSITLDSIDLAVVDEDSSSIADELDAFDPSEFIESSHED